MSKQQHDDGQKHAAKQELVEAVEILKEVLVDREISAVRSMVGDTESDLTRRLKEAVGKSSDSIETVAKDLTTRIDAIQPKLDSLEQRQQKEMAAAREEATDSVSDLKKELRELQEGSKSQLQTMQEEMLELIADKGAEFKSEFDRLREAQTELQNQLHEQAAQSQQVSALLQNMGAVFAGAAGAPTAATIAASGSAEPSIEDTLDEMFQEVDGSVAGTESVRD